MLIYPSVTGTAPQLGIYLRVQLKQMWFNNIKQWESHSLSLFLSAKSKSMDRCREHKQRKCRDISEVV